MSTRKERKARWHRHNRCIACSEKTLKGGHYIPGGFGTPGFFMCTETLDTNGKVVPKSVST